jgi:predicted dehydrogenase
VVERREALTGSSTGVTAFDDLPSALPHVDAVVIAAPPQDHARLALEAIIAGRHVLIEKPMTTSAASARRLISAAADHGVILMVGHTFEYNAAVWKLRDLVRSGELGEIYYIDTARLNLGMYRRDVNVVWDLAPHDISIINYILGSSPTAALAWGSRYAQSLQEDVAYLQLDYTDIRIRAQIHVSWLDPCKVRRVTIVGSRKMAVYNDLADQERIRIYDKGVSPSPQDDIRNVPMSYRHGGISLPFIPMQEPLIVQDRHFAECVITGRRPDSDGASGLAVVQALEASAQSLRCGAAVAIPRDPLVSPGAASVSHAASDGA